MRALMLVTAVAALAASPVEAQRRLSGGVITYLVRLSTPTEASSQTGNWIGAEGAISFGKYRLTVRGLTGSLRGNPLVFDRRARLTSLSLRRDLTRWLAVGVDAEAHRQASDVSIQVWRLFGAGATIVTPLGVPGIEAHGGLAVFPLTSVGGAKPISTGTRAEIGLAYLPARVPVEVQLAYREETVNVPEAVDFRLGGIILGAALRLGR